MVRLPCHIQPFYDSFIYLNRTKKQLKMTPEMEDHFNEKGVETVRGLVSQNGIYTVEKLSMISGINSSALFAILKPQLKLRKVCFRWVHVTHYQKQDHSLLSKQLLKNISTLWTKKAKWNRHWRWDVDLLFMNRKWWGKITSYAPQSDHLEYFACVILSCVMTSFKFLY